MIHGIDKGFDLRVRIQISRLGLNNPKNHKRFRFDDNFQTTMLK